MIALSMNECQLWQKSEAGVLQSPSLSSGERSECSIKMPSTFAASRGEVGFAMLGKQVENNSVEHGQHKAHGPCAVAIEPRAGSHHDESASHSRSPDDPPQSQEAFEISEMSRQM